MNEAVQKPVGPRPLEHLNTFKKFADLLQFSKSGKALAFGIMLATTAGRRYAALPASMKEMYARVRAAHVQKYIGLPKTDIMRTIRDSRQRRGEPVEDYTAQLTALMTRTSLEPVKIALDYTEGLLPEIKRYVLAALPGNRCLHEGREGVRAIRSQTHSVTPTTLDIEQM